jgi:hypothetical protein
MSKRGDWCPAIRSSIDYGILRINYASEIVRPRYNTQFRVGSELSVLPVGVRKTEQPETRKLSSSMDPLRLAKEIVENFVVWKGKSWRPALFGRGLGRGKFGLGIFMGDMKDGDESSRRFSSILGIE